MKRITRKKIIFKNYKSFEDLTIVFNEGITNVYGANGTGKTSLAFTPLWAKWGKDYLDRKDFEITPLNINNNPIPDVDSSVIEVYDIDGKELNFERIFVPKWAIGDSGEKQIVSNTTNYKWNNVPLGTKRDFVEKVKSIFGNEESYNILTNHLYFCSKLYGWEKRRSVFVDITGEVTDDYIVGDNTSFKKLMEKLSNKTIVEYNREVKAQIDVINKRIELIPDLIKENERDMPEALAWEALELGLANRGKEIKKIDAQLLDRSKVIETHQEDKDIWQGKINATKDKITGCENTARTKANELASVGMEAINKLKLKVQKLEGDITLEKSNLSSLNISHTDKIKSQDILREKHKTEREKVFVIADGKYNCPLFNKPCDSEMAVLAKDEAEKNFNITKSNTLSTIQTDGIDMGVEIQSIKDSIIAKKGDIKKLEAELEPLKKELEIKESNTCEPQTAESIWKEDTEWINFHVSLKNLTDNPIELPSQDNANAELIKSKDDLLAKSREIVKKLEIKKEIDKKVNRTKELNDEHSRLSQESTVLVGEKDVIDSFNNAKIAEVEGRINKLLPDNMKVKMFRKQLNGGIDNICDIIIDGVPFLAANDGGQLYAGINIINLLHKHYHYVLPIDIDRRDLVTNIPETKAQVINFYVSPEDLTLRIE